MRNFFVPNNLNDYKPYLLRNTSLLVYTLLLLVVNSFSGLLGLPEVSASSINTTNIVELTNVEREKFGLARLSGNSQLDAAALAKANNMFEEQYWDHFGPNGETPWQFIKGAGYVYVYAGENLAKGFKTAEGVVQAWMASPTHRGNILSGNYKDIGVAAVSGELLGENIVLVVQMFGNQTNQVSDVAPTPPPEVNGSVQQEEGEIKSIKITSPDEGQVINDPGVDIKGEVDGVSGDYVVTISELEKEIGTVDSDSEEWTYEKPSDWSEGEHEVEATLDSEVSDSVTFTVDSSPPMVKADDIEVEESDTEWIVTFQIDDEVESVNIVSGGTTYPASNEGETFTVRIEDSSLGGSVIILASDAVGNTSETDITDLFPKEEEVTGFAAPVINWVNGIDYKSVFNILFAAFILALLSTEVYVFFRKGMLAKRSTGLMTLGVWWLLLVIGIVTGFGGSIS